MTYKTTILASLAALTIAAAPALAQMPAAGAQADPASQTGAMGSGAMSSGSMQSGAMGSGAMDHGAMPKMTAAQTRTMKKCQAMTSDMMAKNKTCTKMMKMHPEMMGSGAM